jgi:hypothetical protein
MKTSFFILPIFALFSISGCVHNVLPAKEGEQRDAVIHLERGGQKSLSEEQRAVEYLDAAAEASALLGSRGSGEAGAAVYNKAAADLTVLLRASSQGNLWNRPLTLTSGSQTYHLHFAKGTRDGVWDPSYFTTFKPAADVPDKNIARRNFQNGVGGALVGVHKTNPLESFLPLIGVTAPVTAVLDFKGCDATLTLVDPSRKPKARAVGAVRVMNADFSAPLAYYPQKSEYWNGIMGALRVSKYMNTTGLYLVQPYDPDRIPLIFVHGLISTPRMWRNVINELESDPELRGKYQCLAFGYPTGNPPAYSALRFREELAKFYQIHPNARKCVLVGHSMGGIVSRMQAVDVNREDWNVIGRDKAARFFAAAKNDSLVEHAVIFKANPHLGRIIFICTPHLGSEMALGMIGNLGRRLISLPLDLTKNVTGSAVAVFTGDSSHMPNSVTGLSPDNPMLKVIGSRPIKVPFHTIAGDRGKGDTPKSSDGIVAYWSSHVGGARSECIVPGPHGSCELPETITELRRILHLHLSNRNK